MVLALCPNARSRTPHAYELRQCIARAGAGRDPPCSYPQLGFGGVAALFPWPRRPFPRCRLKIDRVQSPCWADLGFALYPFCVFLSQIKLNSCIMKAGSTLQSQRLFGKVLPPPPPANWPLLVYKLVTFLLPQFCCVSSPPPSKQVSVGASVGMQTARQRGDERTIWEDGSACR